MMPMVTQLPTWALVLLVLFGGYMAYIVGIMILRTLIDLAERAMSAVSLLINVGSSALVEFAVKFASMMSSLTFLGVRWTFQPAGTRFEMLRVWLAGRLAQGPKLNEQAHQEWVQSVQERIAEAREVLGLPVKFSHADLQQVHRKMMISLHTNKGGSEWMTKQANAAKDFLKKVYGWT